jgi:hypothetical protein
MAITIAGSGIVSANIADGTIVSADITDGTIVDADMGGMAASKLTGALSAASSALITLSTVAPATPVANTLYSDSICHVWAQFVINADASAPTLGDDYNVSAVSRSGAGYGTVSYGTAVRQTTYAVVGTAEDAGSSNVLADSFLTGSFRWKISVGSDIGDRLKYIGIGGF